jgi:hypothetical protein
LLPQGGDEPSDERFQLAKSDFHTASPGQERSSFHLPGIGPKKHAPERELNPDIQRIKK